jgi:cobyrinic acid a,c-diamide synthase
MHVLANGVGSPAMRHAARQPAPDIHWAGSLARDDAAACRSGILACSAPTSLPDLMARLDRLADALATLPIAQLPEPVPIADAGAPPVPACWPANASPSRATMPSALSIRPMSKR